VSTAGQQKRASIAAGRPRRLESHLARLSPSRFVGLRGACPPTRSKPLPGHCAPRIGPPSPYARAAGRGERCRAHGGARRTALMIRPTGRRRRGLADEQAIKAGDSPGADRGPAAARLSARSASSSSPTARATGHRAARRGSPRQDGRPSDRLPDPRGPADPHGPRPQPPIPPSIRRARASLPRAQTSCGTAKLPSLFSATELLA